MNVGFVSCSKTKQTGEHAARDLYVSPLFKFAWGYASSHCDQVFILSAKHGVLRPTDPVSDYDVTLNDLSREERARWAREVITKIRRVIRVGDKLHFYCGKLYREDVILPLRTHHECTVPLEGLSFGRQLRWYKERSV